MQPFSFSNSYDGFCKLQTKLKPFGIDNLVIALESTAHYDNNLVEYLMLHDYKVCILNPLQTSSFRRNNIRKTKTDRIDAKTIAMMLMSDVDLKSYTDTAFHNEELKSSQDIASIRYRNAKS